MVCLGGYGGRNSTRANVLMARVMETFVGTVAHKLSHRAMTVKVYVSTQASNEFGRNPSEVAMSVLDQKIIELATSSGYSLI